MADVGVEGRLRMNRRLRGGGVADRDRRINPVAAVVVAVVVAVAAAAAAAVPLQSLLLSSDRSSSVASVSSLKE